MQPRRAAQAGRTRKPTSWIQVCDVIRFSPASLIERFRKAGLVVTAPG